MNKVYAIGTMSVLLFDLTDLLLMTVTTNWTLLPYALLASVIWWCVGWVAVIGLRNRWVFLAAITSGLYFPSVLTRVAMGGGLPPEQRGLGLLPIPLAACVLGILGTIPLLVVVFKPHSSGSPQPKPAEPAE